MGIKCSLFGHDFGEAAVERERDEQGNEVVSTIREIETCQRCGETRVVSENTEVTTIKTPGDVGEDMTPDEDGAGTADGADGDSVDADRKAPGESGVDIVDAEADEPAAQGAGASSHAEEPEFESAAEDDGVILEDETDDGERDPGEWPDEGADSEATADVGTVSEPAPATDDGDTAADRSSAEPDLGRAESDLDQSEPDLGTGTNTESITDGVFQCTECAFSTPIDASSLREGDYCPECHRGTLVAESS